MANYDSNYAIAQEISARIGVSPIPFDSVYSIALDIYNELGGEPAEFDSVYSILLGILPLVEGGVASKIIDDSVITTAKTWSSSKINSELNTKASIDYVDEQIEAVIGAGNSDIEGKETEDFTFVQTLPVEGEEGQQVIIKGDNTDTLYKYVSGEWVEQTPDATKLYFDTEHEVLYSYATAEHQFVRISMVNTIVVGSNLNTNADLKAIKTVGVYNVVQRLHNATKGDYVKNWTLYVESVDYEEYDKSDSVYQRLVSNYTIQKRTWSATRTTNDGWSNFSTYYAGEIKDTTTSKYYTWSSNKISNALANIPQLEAGQNIEVEDNKINALGYKYDSEHNSFTELPMSFGNKQEFLMDYSSEFPNFELLFSGEANATIYTLSGETAPMMAELALMPPQLLSVFLFTFDGDRQRGITAVSVDENTGVVSITLTETLDAVNAVNNLPALGFWAKLDILVSGDANATTYSYVDTTGLGTQFSTFVGKIIKVEGSANTPKIISAVDGEGSGTFTVDETLDVNNAVTNKRIEYIQEVFENFALGKASHTEGQNTIATGTGAHAEGEGNRRTVVNGTFDISDSSNTVTGTTEAIASISQGDVLYIAGVYVNVSGVDSQNNIFTTSQYSPFETSQSGVTAEIVKGIAAGSNSHAEGYLNTASGSESHAEGSNNKAYGNYSHAEGSGNKAGNTSHAEGVQTHAYNSSHSEGFQTLAAGAYSHAEGYICEIYEGAAFGHAEGEGCMVSARHGHVEGRSSHAFGDCAHAEGRFAESGGEATHAEGWYTKALNRGEHAEGMYNLSHTGSTAVEKTIHSVGIGSAGDARVNAQEVMHNGDIYVKGIGGYQGTDTKSQDNTIKTLQEVVNSKADAYETATTAEIEAMFS